MNVVKTNLPDVLILEPKVFGDSRGFFKDCRVTFRLSPNNPKSGAFSYRALLIA